MDFIQPTESRGSFPKLPSVALKFNGIYLEEKLEGYRTLNVSGREMLSYDIQSDRRMSGHGSIRYGKTLPSRVISVQYRLKAESAMHLQYKFNQLRRLLYSEGLVPISFLDEPETTYYGEFESAENVPEDRLTVVSRFGLFCPDPHKFGDVITTSGLVSIDTFYETYPVKIILTTASATNSIDITNGEQTIQLRGEINGGSRIVMDVVNQTVQVNGDSRRDLLDLHSDFENFEIKKGQMVTTNNGTIELQMREVK